MTETAPWLRQRTNGICPNCGFGSGFSLSIARKIWPLPSDNQVEFAFNRSVVEIVRVCLNCEKTVLDLFQVENAELTSAGINVHNHAAPHEQATFTQVHVWPPRAPRELHESVPEDVRSFFREASVCENAGAMRAAGAMYRAATEEIVKEQGGTGRNLYEKVESLTATLGEDLVRHFHEARMVGNDSIHDGLPYSADEVADIADLVDEACRILYVQPAERAALAAKRAARREAAKTEG